MATFELYFVEDKAIRKEHKNAYYSLMEDERAIAGILRDFGLDPAANRIVSGHVPVKVKDGESAVKCGGHVLVIDGGMSRAYQATSGIAGFTLVHGDACAGEGAGARAAGGDAGTGAGARAAGGNAGTGAADVWTLIAHQPVGSFLEPEVTHLPALAPL